MKHNQAYPIKYVSIQTGLKPYIIRSWEGRYKAVCPSRSANNRRTFSEDDIARLKLLKRAIEAGHSISHVAGLSDQELQRLLTLADSEGATLRPTASRGVAVSESDSSADCEKIVESALYHIAQLDAPALESVLDHAAVDLPRHAFIKKVVLPLYERIGEMWRSGRIKAANEHMLSVVVRTMLWDMVRTAGTPRDAPRILVTTPAGHWHELGSLTAALVASETGWRVHYFGPNLPAEEIAYAVHKIHARAIGLGICHGLNDYRLSVELENLRRLVGREVPIFVGGGGARSLGGLAERIELRVCEDLDSFRSRLESALSQQFIA